ncbi:MAG: ABC transporter ATP-binding protein/permease [Oscillospiraceae bacterium]|nr:ABC transporter ATP-binding protein/permease [Oscillospiraceae bacterium]
MKKEKESASVFRNNAYMFKLAWRISPSRVVLEFIDNALDRINWIFAAVIFMRLIINGLERNASFGEMVATIALSTALLVVIAVFRSWVCHKYSPEADLRVNEKLYTTIFDQSANVELACYEDPEFYSKYTLAVKEVGDRLGSVIRNSLPGFAIILAAMGYVIYQMFLIDRFLLFFAIFPLIGTFVFDKTVQQLRYKQTLENNINDRKKGYVNRIFYLAQYAKEMRLSNVAKILNRQYDEGYKGAMSVYKKYAKRIFMPSFLNDMFTHAIVYYGVFLYGAYRVIVSQTIAVSEFVILFGAMRYVTMHLEFFSEGLMNFYQNALYIRNLRSFLEYKPAIPEDQPGEEVRRFDFELELRGVGFTYRGSDKEQLRNVNMKIKRGEKIAIVGHNGAGKSTLIKLLMRLYDPTSGEILLDGKNIKTYNLQDYRGLFSAAFQDQRVFSVSVADNVSEDREKAIHAMKQSGIWDRVQRMPHKENSTLTREFDPEGVVLSGGETQKVSIARAFARDFGIGIFDEPSSALDPIAEYNLFESMMEAFEGKTVIFISHRLSSARLADRIYLFENGAVLEEGSHDELMQKNGAYAEMFAKQAEKYIENEYTLLEDEGGAV